MILLQFPSQGLVIHLSEHIMFLFSQVDLRVQIAKMMDMIFGGFKFIFGSHIVFRERRPDWLLFLVSWIPHIPWTIWLERGRDLPPKIRIPYLRFILLLVRRLGLHH